MQPPTGQGMESEMDNDSIKINWNDASGEVMDYTRPSVPALLAAALGLSAFLVYVSHWFFFLGVIAFLLGLFALWSIRNAEGILTGTSLACFGMSSAMIALISVAVFWHAYQYGVRREADQFFRLWFAAVQQGNIPRAKEYHTIYAYRSEADNAEEWWKAQYENKYAHRAVHQYVEDKLIRVLMALGDKAKISYYKTLDIISDREEGADTVVSVYAVTFPAEFDQTETFFVKIAGKRVYPLESPDFKAAGWRIDGMPGNYFPDEWPQ